MKIFYLLFFLLSFNLLAEEKTIIFGSCNPKKNIDVWENINKYKPDIFLSLGDFVYFDEIPFTKRDLFTKYQGKYSNPIINELYQKSLFLGIWDDHDFGWNDSDSTFPYKDLSFNVFNDFWKNNPKPLITNVDNIFTVYKLKDLQIILTDNRSFRINKNYQSYFGKKQLELIGKLLLDKKIKTTIIASGASLLSHNSKQDLFFKFKNEKKEFDQYLKNSNQKIIILSGDAHYAEALKTNYNNRDIYEVISSPFSGFPQEYGLIDKQRNSIFLYNKTPNFGLLKVYDNQLIDVYLYSDSNEEIWSLKNY